ncbi:MAG: cyclic nucleotide-binding domain-containing protein [Legionellales bacterium]|nr:cyclic nucleotide-binding domain-containing protein [Legionellales bacterium]
MKNRKKNHIDCKTCPVAQFCLAGGLDSQSLAELNHMIAYAKEYSRGEYIYAENDPVKYLYAIRQGTCKSYYLNQQGEERVHSFELAGNIVGLEYINDKTYNTYAQTLEHSMLCLIPIKEFKDFLQSNSAQQNRILTILSNKLKEKEFILPSTSAKQRVAAFYLDIIHKITDRSRSDNEIMLKISQMDISNQLGITHETLSRVLRNFIQSGILKIKNNAILYANTEMLSDIALFNKNYLLK